MFRVDVPTILVATPALFGHLLGEPRLMRCNHPFLPRRLTTLLTPFLLGSLVAAQMTYLVGPNGMPNLQTALFVAQDGDNIHVEPGTYPGIDCTVGVSIRALQPGTVTLTGGVRLTLTSAQTAHLTGLVLDGSLQVLHGNAVVIDTTIDATGYAIYTLNARVHLIGGDVASWSGIFHSAAMRVDNSDITAIDSRFRSGAGDGIFANNSRLHLSHVEAGGGLLGTTGSGITAMNLSTIWLTDCHAASLYSCPLYVWGGGVLYVDGVTHAGTGIDCGTTTSKSMLAVTQPGPLLAGAPFSLEYRGQPNGIVAVFAAPLLARHDVFPLLDQPSWLDPSTSFVAGLSLLDASGHATMTWNIPGGPAIPDLSLWFKGISGLDLPLQVSPVAGGIAR